MVFFQKNQSSMRRHFKGVSVAFAVVSSFFLGACEDDKAFLIKEEASSLEKSLKVFKDIGERTEKALRENEHEERFQKVRFLLLNEAKGGLVEPKTAGWSFETFHEKAGVGAGQRIVAKNAKGKTADVLKLLQEWSAAGQKGFLTSIKVDENGAEVEVERWLSHFPPRSIYLRGDLPKFKEIKLGNQLQKHRINPNHIVQPENAALKKQVDEAYLSLEKDQVKLIGQGHSQVLAPMSQLLQRIQGLPSALKNASVLLNALAADASSLRVMANERGLLFDRSILEDKGVALQKSASTMGFFLDQMQVNKTLRFLAVRKAFPPLDLTSVVVPKPLVFESK